MDPMQAKAGARALGGAVLACALTLPAAALATPALVADDEPRLYLVTLAGPGLAGYRGERSRDEQQDRLLARQEALLRFVSAEPVYRWTTALNGFAVRLQPDEAALLPLLSDVALVEPDRVRRVAGTVAPAAAATASAPGNGGRGVVVGVVDTGLDPEGPVFAEEPGLGRPARDFGGTCPAGEDWDAVCNDKVVAARWFVEGFSEDRLGSSARLSPADDHGHGTQVASLAVGNSRVTALDRGRRLGTFSGVAPRARLAVYKACWTAPDPADDGCSSADVVAAVDQAVSDGVDVLSVAVGGSSRVDTVDLALLGATEADTVVAAAAGNSVAAAGHAQPWLTTVGAVSGPRRTGRLAVGDRAVSGILTARQGLPATRLVDASAVPAPGFAPAQARLCLPGSLDAGRVAGQIVVCDRGQVPRVDKSAAVALADGVGLVLVSGRGEPVTSDFHAVPTLAVSAAAGREVRGWIAAPGRVRATLSRVPAPPSRPRLTPWSPAASPRATTVKPDLVAPGSALLSATAHDATGRRWDLLSGTSASTAVVTGLAARVRAAHPEWSAARVRSALATSATSVGLDTDGRRQGAGLVSPARALAPGLVHDVDPAAYRRVLEGRLDALRLNLPGAVVPRASRTVTFTRTVTNVGGSWRYYSSSAAGFTRHGVTVSPAAIRIGPGQTRTYRVTVTPGVRPSTERGWVTWRGGDGTRVRIPVVLR